MAAKSGVVWAPGRSFWAADVRDVARGTCRAGGLRLGPVGAARHLPGPTIGLDAPFPAATAQGAVPGIVTKWGGARPPIRGDISAPVVSALDPLPTGAARSAGPRMLRLEPGIRAGESGPIAVADSGSIPSPGSYSTALQRARTSARWKVHIEAPRALVRSCAQIITHLTSKHLSSLSEVHPAWPPAGGHACAQSAASSPNLLAGARPRSSTRSVHARPYIRVRAIGHRVAPPSSRFLTSFPTSRRSFVPPRSPRRRTW